MSESEKPDLSLLPTIQPSLVSKNVVLSIETVQFGLWCFTVPFYSFLLFFMIDAQFKKIEELNTPFFKLCISTAIIDLCICQATSVSLLATNRLSAILFPNQYQKMWRKNRLRIAFAVQFLPGCTLSLLTFFNSVQLYQNDNPGIVPKFTNPKWTTIYFSIGGCFLLANCLYLILAYCYLFKVLRTRNNDSLQSSTFNLSLTTLDHNHRRQSLNKSEKRLFIMCSIIVSVQLTVLLFFFLKVVAPIKLTVDEFYMFYSALSNQRQSTAINILQQKSPAG